MNTMLRRACWALLAIATCGGVVTAQAEQPPAPGKGVETASQLATINADLAELKKTQAEILRMLQEAAPALLQLDKTNLQVQKNTNDLGALKDRLERLETRVNRLETERAADTRRAGALGSGSAAPVAVLGQIQLSNLYWTPITVVVDGISYTLLPNETRYLSRQPGAFMYEVLGVQPSVVRTLAAGETFTIRINR